METPACRCGSPTELRRATDPVGPLNDESIIGAMRHAHLVIAAWGARGAPERVAALHRLRDEENADRERLARRDGHDAYLRDPMLCLGVSKNGAPRHPLYVAGSTELVKWEARS